MTCSMTTKLDPPKKNTDASLDDDDFHEGQRSSEVKYGKLCALATIFGQKSC